MTTALEYLLALVSVGLLWAILGAPLTWLAIRSARKFPERAKGRAVPWAVALAVWSGLILGLVGFVIGAGVLDENAGAAAMLLFSVGCSGGAPIGFALWVFITRRAAIPQRVAADSERSAVRMQRASVVLLALGTTTSLTGMGFSLSIGMLSLALAAQVVRPLGVIFVALHLLAAGLSLRVAARAQSDFAKGRAHSALVVNVCGLLCAGLISYAGPGFFKGLVGAAAAGIRP